MDTLEVKKGKQGIEISGKEREKGSNEKRGGNVVG